MQKDNGHRRRFGTVGRSIEYESIAGADVEGSREDRRGRPRLEARRLEDVGVADRVGEDDPVAVVVQAPDNGPSARAAGRRAGRRGPGAAGRRTSRSRGRPSRGRPGWRIDLAGDPRVDLVLAVEVDPVPVDEALPGPGGGEPQRVVVVERPSAGRARRPPGPGRAGRRSPCRRSSCRRRRPRGRHQARAVVHRRPRARSPTARARGVVPLGSRRGTPDRRAAYCAGLCGFR